MSEDDSRHEAPAPERHPDKPRRSWLDRIGAALSGEPTTREDLVELLRDVQADGLIGPDTLRMMEGAIAVADLTVADVMVPRAQMVALPVDGRFLELMRQVVESGHSRFPVHGEDKDEILGILLAKDLLRGVVADNGPGSIRELLRPAQALSGRHRPARAGCAGGARRRPRCGSGSGRARFPRRSPAGGRCAR